MTARDERYVMTVVEAHDASIDELMDDIVRASGAGQGPIFVAAKLQLLRQKVEADVVAREREPYNKQHLDGCRKVVYDPKSSPCTCRTEFETLVGELKLVEASVVDIEARVRRNVLRDLASATRKVLDPESVASLFAALQKGAEADR